MTFPLGPSARGGPDGDVPRRAAAERFARWVDHGRPSGLPLPGAVRTRRRLRVRRAGARGGARGGARPLRPGGRVHRSTVQPWTPTYVTV
ncbi:hypothetical protein B9W68_17365 [Streptomyces sp. CS227]|nr:hypothetical protein B9W68_17365 [Streptomyces sp. CS227]